MARGDCKLSLITSHWLLVTGFTLIELVIVSVVIAILLAASVPRFQQTANRLRTEQLAYELVQTLHYARQRAMAEDRVIGWVWDSNLRQVRLDSMGDGQNIEALDDPWVQRVKVPGGLTIRLEWEDLPLERIQFFPDGTSDPAVLEVIPQDKPGSVYTITVEPATGQATFSP